MANTKKHNVRKIAKKLPKKFKTKLITALKSGNYRQGDGCLFDKDTNTYDVLGVACSIAEIGKKHFVNEFFPDFIPKFAKRLPKVLRGNTKFVCKLSNMNDTGKSFKKIAKWIKKNL